MRSRRVHGLHQFRFGGNAHLPHALEAPRILQIQMRRRLFLIALIKPESRLLQAFGDFDLRLVIKERLRFRVRIISRMGKERRFNNSPISKPRIAANQRE